MSPIHHYNTSGFFKWRMCDIHERETQTDQLKRNIKVHIMPDRFHEREIFQYIIQRVRGAIHMHTILNAMKIPKTCIMIVVGMRPDDSINMADSFLEHLPPQIWTSINENSACLRFYKYRKPKPPAFPARMRVHACG